MDGTAHGNGEARRHRAVAVALVTVVLASAGCTICPDPFDYSGPVPDGSPPQNDFRARAGGILPLGAAPRPWPAIVEQPVRPDDMPVIADEEPEEPAAVVAELRQTSVLVPERDEPATGEVDGDEERSVPNASPTGLLPVPTAAVDPDLPTAGPDGTGLTGRVTEHVADVVVTPPTAGSAESAATEAKAPAPTVGAPSSEPRESPGWRPRRRPAR